MIVKEYQVTLICATNQYKPVSCIIKVKQEKDVDLTKDKEKRKELIKEGTKKICGKRYWTSAELIRFNYSKARVRLYDKAKIEAENKERYEQIKEEKYTSGEWKRPKEK